MTQDEIIDMARQAGIVVTGEAIYTLCKLVAAKATEEANAKANASWTLMCEKMFAFEREACAKQLDNLGCDHCATAIRARGEQA
jgi:hypothetical protein